MGFEALLGNQRLKENLTNAVAKGRISHFYLICGPEGSGKHTLANLLAAAILCQDREKPCGRCHPCRKVSSGLHPDYITIDDPEHKNIAVKVIRQFREDVFIRPNESDYKIYLIPQEMGIEGQNALLKILEEPPSYGVFLLLAENPEKLLPTVRSRCTELNLLPLPDKVLCKALTEAFPQADEETIQAAMVRSGGYLGQAKQLLQEGAEAAPQTKAFLEAFGSRDSLALLQTLVPMEKWKRDQLIPVLNQWLTLLESALACRAGQKAMSPLSRKVSTQRSAQEILGAIQALQTCIEYAQGNVSCAAICGYLTYALR